MPYLETLYQTAGDVIDRSNLVIMSLMVLLLVVLPTRFGRGKRKLVGRQMGGENLGGGIFRGAMGVPVQVTLRNWYLEDWFGERRMMLVGFTLCLFCLLTGLAVICGGALHV